MNNFKVGDKVKFKEGLAGYRYFTNDLDFYTYTSGIYGLSTHAVYTVSGVDLEHEEPYVEVFEHSYFMHPDDLEKVC